MSFIPIGAPRFKAPGCEYHRCKSSIKNWNLIIHLILVNKKLIPMSSKADEDIQLNFSNARSYKKCDSYNPQDYLPATWHQITVRMQSIYCTCCNY